MRVTVQIRIEGAGSRPFTVPLHAIDRPCDQVQDVGLALGDAKSILGELQQELVHQQLESYLAERRACPHCGRPRAIKGYHPLRFRTAFGDIALRSPRWRRCRCEQSREATFCPLSELLTVHTSPELAYLQAKWAAQVSFAAVGTLLRDVLPADQGLRPETIRRHVLGTAERLEAQLGPEQFAYDGGSRREIEASPELAAPITVGLDGGYVRGRERLPGANGCFEVIAGKSIPEEGAAKVIAKRFVKKQQMRWTPRGAHLLLQVRTQVLNHELRGVVRELVSGLRSSGSGAARSVSRRQRMLHCTPPGMRCSP